MRAAIEILLEELIDAQRSLTRAVLQNDSQMRPIQHERRNKIVEEIKGLVSGSETQRRVLGDEVHRLGNEVMQIRYVTQLMREAAPLIVSECESRASAVVHLPDPSLASFEVAIEEAIKNGHAKRLNGDVVITYPGLLELSRAAQVREQFDDLRTEHFQLERKLHDLEKKGTTAAPAAPIKAAKAVGA